METRIKAIWAELDTLALALGDPKAVAAGLAENRELMLTYWRSFEQMQAARPGTNGAHRAQSQPTKA